MKLAIADPPYHGRAHRYYGLGGHGGGGGNRRKYKADDNPEAHLWDKVETHLKLIETLNNEFEGWAIAMSSHNLSIYLSEVQTGSTSPYRVGAWIKPSSVPSGSRIRNGWEPVLFRIPNSRRSHAFGFKTQDYVIANPLRNNFIGSKPPAWTKWVLSVLGATKEDEIIDLFPGSGAVSKELEDFSGK